MISALLVLLASAMTAVETESVPVDVPEFEEMPKIDFHAHYFDDMPLFVEMLKRIDMRAVNICFYQTEPMRILGAQRIAEALAERYHPTFFYVSTFDLTRRDEPDYAEQVIAFLDRTFETGALMVKLWKEAGMQERTPDGEYLMPDDPVLDPIYAHLAERGVPLLVHAADPIDAWQPLDSSSPHYNYYSNNPEWYVYGREGFPSHKRIMEARDNIMAKHPDLVVIGAHLGSLTHDLDALAERLERYPNFHVDVSARTYILRGKPSEKVRAFFMKYQDRILYGTDFGRFSGGRTISEDEQTAYAESIEQSYRRDFAYFAESNGNSLGLPRDLLEKFYYKNAERLIPDLAVSR